jgi:hypothetical protein
MDNEGLLQILHASYKNNSVNQVTGMLLYKSGNFMQVLEGPEESVLSTFEKIQSDSRHKEIIVISQEEIEERQFADWKMAFVNMDDDLVQKEEAFSDFLKDDLTSDVYRQNPKMAYVMLLSFKKNIR